MRMRPETAAVLIGSLLFTGAHSQPFVANTNTIIAPVNGVVYITMDGSNWVGVLANTIRFDMPPAVDTNAPPPPPPSKTTNAAPALSPFPGKK